MTDKQFDALIEAINLVGTKITNSSSNRDVSTIQSDVSTIKDELEKIRDLLENPRPK